MHIGHPENIWLLFLWPFLAVFLIFSFIKGRKTLEKFAQLPMLSQLLEGFDIRRRKVRVVILLISLLFIMVTFLGPQWGARMLQLTQKGTDIIIALDTSLSMEARDMKPSRIAAAKEALSGLLDSLIGNRIGIIGFSGTAYNFCPLTLDISAAKLFLEEINTTLMPIPGTSIGDAIRLAVGSFPKGTKDFRRLILITDGEDHKSNPIEAANAAKKAGIVIDTIGIGSAAGEPIPVTGPDGKPQGYKKDRSGKLVMSRLDEKTLKQIAAITGGSYYHATPGLSEIAGITREIDSAKKKEMKTNTRRIFEERFQIPLCFGLVLLILEGLIPERRREKKP